MKNVTARLGQRVRNGYVLTFMVLAILAIPLIARAAPYADLVIDARTGEVLHATNADTRLHPASLTKMMTLYIAFEAIERGEISLDSKVTISKHAASQPPSKLGLKAGQTIALRYLIRAAAIKSANDAATAIGEAIEGSEPAFAKRMTRTAKALGMTRTTFRNANGLTAEGHLSTARDMVTLGRHVFYDFPQYYNIFSRRSADAGMAQVNSTNRRFLDSYEGADGIKTGYTTPAGFNLVASAQRGNKRIIASVFGGKSTAQRNSRMAELLDLGFGKAPNKAIVQKPAAPQYLANAETVEDEAEDTIAAAVAAAVAENGSVAAGKTLRLVGAVVKSPRPRSRSGTAAPEPDDALLIAMQDNIAAALAEVQTVAAAPDAAPDMAPNQTAAASPEPETPAFAQATAPQPETRAAAQGVPAPLETLQLAAAESFAPPTSPKPLPTPRAAFSPQILPGTDIAATPQAEAPPPGTLLFAQTPPRPAGQTILAAAPALVDVSAPKARPEQIVLAALSQPETVPEELEVVTRVSTSGGRQWAINIGSFPSRYHAERMLLQTALVEMNSLDEALRKVVSRKGAFDANFVGMTREMADLACSRLQARKTECRVIGP